MTASSSFQLAPFATSRERQTRCSGKCQKRVRSVNFAYRLGLLSTKQTRCPELRRIRTRHTHQRHAEFISASMLHSAPLVGVERWMLKQRPAGSQHDERGDRGCATETVFGCSECELYNSEPARPRLAKRLGESVFVCSECELRASLLSTASVCSECELCT